MKIEILPSAREDLAEGFVFYEKQSPGLGSYFLDSLFADIDSLSIHGGIHRRVFGSHRLLGRTFPFAVYYDITGEHSGQAADVDVPFLMSERQNPRPPTLFEL